MVSGGAVFSPPVCSVVVVVCEVVLLTAVVVVVGEVCTILHLKDPFVVVCSPCVSEESGELSVFFIE